MSEGGETKRGTIAPGMRLAEQPRVLARCPVCSESFGGRPFCARDGQLSGEPFSVSGRYVVEELIGSGGFSFVFGARHHLLGKPVAIKVLRPDVAADADQAARFLREARMASQLQHENIVGVLDFGKDDGHGILFLGMDRQRGSTLDQVMQSSAAMPVARALPILTQLARALTAAHAEGVIHRDLNPRNIILVDSSGRQDLVKLCDFGLSRLETGWDRITTTGMLLGTPAYMAPEQIRGEPAQDARVDLYAFGVTAYEMLSGRLPYEARTPVSLISQKLSSPPLPLRDAAPGIEVPPALEEIVMRCLALDLRERPFDAAEVEAALARAQPRASSAGAEEAAAPVPADLVGTALGSYRITARLGTGGAGTVYLGEHTVIGARVAVKVLLPEVAQTSSMVERFIAEARASSRIGSPHIPTYFDFGYLADGRPYAVMEYFEGETLADRLERVGRLSLTEAGHIAAQVASALARAHAAGIVHRDIKPQNLFLSRDPDGATLVKVLDFGIAKLLAPNAGGTRTTVGIMLGTPLYCAPEQALGDEVTPSVDIYSLGATLFQMLTGRPPFEGDASDVVVLKTRSDPPSVTDFVPLPDAVAATVAGMLARTPSLRLVSMNEVLRSVEGWSLAPPSVRAARPASRRLGLALGIAAAAIAIAVAVPLVRGTGRDHEPRPARPAAPRPVDRASAAPPPSPPPPAPRPEPKREAGDEAPDSAAEEKSARPPERRKRRKRPRPPGRARGEKRAPAPIDDAVLADPFAEQPDKGVEQP
jgi:eukaryotic-like serine/threonine-protein kinase